MTSAIVLAMHGAPPNDFPRREMAEFFGLRARLNQVTGAEREPLERRHAELEAKMRAWPRTAQNDRFHAAAHEMAGHLERVTGRVVSLGFNEFCAPGLDDALDQAASQGAERVVVITPMMTRGGEHSEVDIPDAVRRARERHPGVSFVYVWPFEPSEVADFLADQMSRFES